VARGARPCIKNRALATAEASARCPLDRSFSCELYPALGIDEYRTWLGFSIGDSCGAHLLAMDEREFKKHLKDLAHGHHRLEERDWTRMAKRQRRKKPAKAIRARRPKGDHVGSETAVQNCVIPLLRRGERDASGRVGLLAPGRNIPGADSALTR
jgi:hypothetical protein